MTNKKWALILIAVSIPLSYYGFRNFEEGASEPLQAILISLACTGGISCFFGGLYVFFTKAKGRGVILASQTKVGDSPISLALNETPSDFDPDEAKEQNQKAIDDLVLKTTDHTIKSLGGFIAGGNPMAKKKLTKEEKPMAKANTSVDLMKREKKLETRRKELESLLAEVTKEEQAVEKELKSKGWMQQKDGTWSYE